MEVEDYKKMLADNITSSYQKADSEILAETNSEAHILTSKLGLADRVQCYAFALPNSFSDIAIVTYMTHRKFYQFVLFIAQFSAKLSEV